MRFAVSGFLVLLLFGVAEGEITTVPLIGPTGADSDWNVTYDTSSTGIVVDQVNLNLDVLVIQVSKEFTKPKNPLTGLFPPIIMDFIQRLPDAQTVSTIIVADESITNQTGFV